MCITKIENKVLAADDRDLGNFDLSMKNSSILSWFRVFNKELFKNRPVPISSVMLDDALLKLSIQYSVWEQNCRLVREADFIEFRVTALEVLIHRMTCHWFSNYWGEEYNTGWFCGKPFRKKMSEFGIQCSMNGYHLSVGDPFISIIRDGTRDMSGSVPSNKLIA